MLAIGIGATVAIFALTFAVLYKPLPFPDPVAADAGPPAGARSRGPWRAAADDLVVSEVPRVPGSPAGLRRRLRPSPAGPGTSPAPARPNRWLASWSTAPTCRCSASCPALGRSFSLEETQAAGFAEARRDRSRLLGRPSWQRSGGSRPIDRPERPALHDHRRAARGLPRPDRSGRVVRSGHHAGGRGSRREVEPLLLGRGPQQGRRHGRTGRGGREDARRRWSAGRLAIRRAIDAIRVGRHRRSAQRRACRSADPALRSCSCSLRSARCCYRLPQPRQPHARAQGHGARARGGDSLRARREPRPDHASADGRKRGARARRRARRHAGRLRGAHRAARRSCPICGWCCRGT